MMPMPGFSENHDEPVSKEPMQRERRLSGGGASCGFFNAKLIVCAIANFEALR